MDIPIFGLLLVLSIHGSVQAWSRDVRFDPASYAAASTENFLEQALQESPLKETTGFVRTARGRQLPRDVARLMSGSGTQDYTVGRSTITLTHKRNGGVELAQKDPNTDVPLGAVLQSILTQEEVTDITGLPNSFIRTENYKLDTITIAKAGNSFKFTIVAKALVSIKFYEISLAETSLTVKFTRGQDNLIFSLSGSLNAAIIEGEMTISGNKSIAAYNCTFKKASPVQFIDQFFFGDPALTDDVLSFVTEAKLRQMFEVELPNLNLVGVRNLEDGSYQFVAFVEHQFQQPQLMLTVYLIITKPTEGSMSVSLIAKVNSELSLSDIVQYFTNVTNFPKIKIFEGLKARAVGTISSHEIAYFSNPIILDTLKDVRFGNYSQIVPAGVAFHIGLHLKQKLRECSGLTTAYNNLQDESMLTIRIDSTGVSVFPPNETFDVAGIVTCLFGGADKFFNSEFARSGVNFRFNRILYNRTSGKLQIDFEIHTTMTFISENFLKVDRLHVKVTRFNESSPVDFKISFNATAAGSVYTGEISKKNQSYMIDLTASMLPIGKILGVLSSPTITTLNETFSSVVNFGIKDFLFQAKYGDATIYRIAGSPYIFGFDDISIEAIMWVPPSNRATNKFEFAFGLSFNSVNLNDIVRLIVGTNSTTGAWLADIDLAIIACTSTEGLSNAVDNVRTKIQPKAKGNSAPSPSSSGGGGGGGGRGGGSGSGGGSGGSRTSPRRQHRREIEEEEILVSRSNPSNRPGRQPTRGPSRVAPTSGRGGASGARPGGGRAAAKKQKPKMEFMHDTMKDLTLREGLAVIGRFALPTSDDGCRGDGVCLYLREKLADAVLTIKGLFQKKRDGTLNIILSAQIDMELALTDNLYFTQAALAVVIAGRDSSIKVSAALEYRQEGGNTVKFSGSISANANQLKIEMTMDHIWQKPFGVEWLAFGRLHLAVSVRFTDASFTLGFGGTLQVGKIGTPDIIEVQIYFGLNVNNPIASYFYGNISEVTMQKISKAFDLDVEGSKAMMESGFPEGLVFSWNGGARAVKVPKFNIEIQQGIYFKGKINILGYSIAGEIRFHLGIIKVKLELDPIVIGGGALIVQRSEEDSVLGPLFEAEVSRQKISVEIKGYIYVVGIGSEVSIKINNTYFHLHVTGKIFEIITTELDVYASYGALTKSSFEFRACIRIDMAKFKKAIADLMRNVGEKARQLVRDTENFKRTIGRVTSELEKKKRVWDAKLQEKKNRINREIQQLEEEHRHDDCNAQCPETCGGLPTWISKCWKIFGYWVGCPGWDSCAYKSRSALCLAGCHLRNAARSVTKFFKKTGLQIKKGFLTFQDYLLRAVIGVVRFATSIVDKAATLFQQVTSLFADMVDLAAKVVEGSNFLAINHICLFGGIRQGKSACVGLDVDVVLFTFPIKFSKPFCVGPNFLDSAARSTAAQKYPNVDKVDEVSGTIDSELGELKSEQTEVLTKESEVVSEVDKDEPDAETRSKIESLFGKIPSPDRGERRSDIPDTVTAEELTEFTQSAPLVGENQNEDWEGGSAPAYTAGENNTTDNPCSETRSVINKYSQIAEGATRYTEAADRQRLLFVRAKQYWEHELDALGKTLDEADKRSNITHSQRREMHHWYNRARSKISYWVADTTKTVSKYQGSVMKDYKAQLDSITHRHTKRDSVAYMRSLVMKGTYMIKRSGIPSRDVNEQSQRLSAVHQDLESLLTGDKKSVVATRRRLQIINDNLGQLQELHKRCRI